MSDAKALALRIRNTEVLLSQLEESIAARKKALNDPEISAYIRSDLELRVTVDEAKYREHSGWLQVNS